MKQVDWQNPVNWNAPLNRGLVSWWMAGQSSPYWGGPLFRDLCNRHNGNNQGSPFWTGAVGRPNGFGSIVFDATDNYVTTEAKPGIIHTMASWVYVNSFPITSYLAILSQIDNSNYNVWLATKISGPNEILFYHNSDSLGTSAIGGISTNIWYHVVQTRDGDSITNGFKVYLNGILYDQDNSGVSAVHNGPLWFGSQESGGTPIRFMDGYIDDVRLYNYSLSASQVYSLYQTSRLGYPVELNRYRRRRGLSQSIPELPGLYRHKVFNSRILK